ncbi:hypothetical protein LA080_011360 [Diaporthe eres]|nr:hypothetical protein LA080_011360 [Diaporthe eres]
MFGPRSPVTGEKRKRSGADSAQSSRPSGPPLRLSPPPGHRAAQASQRYSDDASSFNTAGCSTSFSDSERHDSDDASSFNTAACLISFSDSERQDSDDEVGHGHHYDTDKETTQKPVHSRKPNSQEIAQAPSGRLYIQFQDGSSAFGALIPDEWTSVLAPKYGEGQFYPCPVRDCGRLLASAKSLGTHFIVRKHFEDLFNDNLDGTLSIKGKRQENEKGRVIISQEHLTPAAGPPAELQAGGLLASKRFQDDPEHAAGSPLQGLIRSSLSEVRGAGIKPKVRNTQLGTAWEVVTHTYDCVIDIFPQCPGDAIIAFLAGLRASERALSVNPTAHLSKRKSSTRGFTLPQTYSGQISSLKAALAQAHGDISRSPCPSCAAGYGIWKVCMKAPTKPGSSEDVLRGACPSCYYNGSGHLCKRLIDNVPEDHVAQPQSTVTATGYADTRAETAQNAKSWNSIRHGMLSSQAPLNSPSVPRSSKRPQKETVSQASQKDDSRALSPQDASGEHDQNRTYSPDKSGSNTTQRPSLMDHARDGAVSQEGVTMEHATTQPVAGQAAEHIVWEFQDMAWGLVRRARELPPNERAALPDRVERVFALASLGPHISEMINRVSELPTGRQAEVSRMIVNILRQMLG